MNVPAMLEILDDHGFQDTSTARKTEAINSAYHDVCSRFPWPFLEVTDDVSTDAAGKITSPTGIRAVRGFYSGTRDLDWQRRDDFLSAYGSRRTEAGDPSLYFFQGNNVYVWPIKQANDWGQIDYFIAEPDLVGGGTAGSYTGSAEADILLPSRHHRVIVDGALKYLYDMEDDPELSARFEGHFESRIQLMYGDLMQRQFDRPDTIKVLDDGFDWGDPLWP